MKSNHAATANIPHAYLVTIMPRYHSIHTCMSSYVLCVLCVLCVVALFSVVEGPCKRYAMTRHVCQVTTASRGRRRSVSPEADRMNKTKRFHRWMAVQAEPTQSEPPTRFPYYIMFPRSDHCHGHSHGHKPFNHGRACTSTVTTIFLEFTLIVLRK
jgi:hypothetical protein